MTFLEATLSRVQVEQRRVDVGRALLAVLLVLPFVLGWSARMTVRGAVWALSFLAAAVRVGWSAAAPAAKDGG